MHKRPPFNPDRLHKLPSSEAKFVAELALYQDSQQMTDVAFVRALGITLVLWRKSRSGRLGLGYKLMVAGADYVGARTYQAAEASLTDRVRGRLLRQEEGDSIAVGVVG